MRASLIEPSQPNQRNRRMQMVAPEIGIAHEDLLIGGESDGGLTLRFPEVRDSMQRDRVGPAQLADLSIERQCFFDLVLLDQCPEQSDVCSGRLGIQFDRMPEGFSASAGRPGAISMTPSCSRALPRFGILRTPIRVASRAASSLPALSRATPSEIHVSPLVVPGDTNSPDCAVHTEGSSHGQGGVRRVDLIASRNGQRAQTREEGHVGRTAL
jgi:hypothetical protein